jgi:4-amino-4-deoxy-L-arabinose transferase-like glycosyltransferase
MSEPLFVVTVTAALLAALSLISAPSSAKRAALLGAAIGLATLTRGEGILLLPLLAWPAAWLGAPRRARALPILAATATTALIIAPWVIRNVVVFHHATLAADSNTVIAGANCPQTYYGLDIGWWSNRCLERARTHRQLLSGDASTSAAYSYAGDHLVRLPLVAVVRVLRTFNFFQPLRQGNRELRRRWVDVASLVFYYALPVLAVLGFTRLQRHRWVLLAPVAMVVIVSALTWGIGRFRIAADISLIVLASSAFAALPGQAARGSRRKEATSDPAPPERSATSNPASRQMMRRRRLQTAPPPSVAARGA